jgi:polar amino acid transport system permease protein
VALVSTAVVVVAVVAVVVSSPGWPRLKASFFNLGVAAESVPAIWDGFLLNLTVLAAVVPVILVLGLALALLRGLRGPAWLPARLFAAFYVDVFRGVPLFVCLLLVGFGLPSLRLTGIPTDPVVLGGLALVLVYVAYVAEVFRAGFNAVDPAQIEAARLDGASSFQVTRLIVLPQALRTVQPALLNDFVALQKDCGLISVLGAVDAVQAARIEAAESYTFTPYLVAAALFVIQSHLSGRLADYAARRVDRAA